MVPPRRALLVGVSAPTVALRTAYRAHREVGDQTASVDASVGLAYLPLLSNAVSFAFRSVAASA